MNLFENIIAKGNIPWTSSLFNSVSSNPKITGNTGGGITPQSLSQAKSSIDVANQIKQKYGFDDKDIRFLRLAKEKGYDSQKAMEYLQNKKVTEKQWPDLGIMGNIKEGAIGAFRSWEQIPAIAGNVLDFTTQKITWPLISGWLDLVWADQLAERWRQGSKVAWELSKKVGEDITMAWMTDGGRTKLTENQTQARKFGGQMALTAPIGGGYISWSKWLWSLAFRSWVVWAWFWGTQPIINKWGETTLWDIGYWTTIGWVTWAIGWPLVSKVIAPAIGWVVSKTGKYWTALIKWGAEWLSKSISLDIKWVWQTIWQKYQWARQYLSGLDEKEISAIEKTSAKELDDIITQAKATQGKQGDYVQTPYHVWATKAQKTLNQLDADLKTRQSERLAVLDEAPIVQIDANDARMALKSALRSMNVEDIRIVDGKPEIIPVKWREALLDLSNPADVKALQKLNEILDWDVSPTQTMDRIKKLQEWAYENKSTIWVKGTSERMDGLIKRVQWSLNTTFKKQLPPEYAKILDSMSEDIKLSNEIKRVFGIDDNGVPVGNRGEMVMKRLVNWTTTGGEAREIAKQIFDRYWIDLVKEARLRQLAMDLVWDDRGQTLFGAITRGKSWLVDLAMQKTLGNIVNKEWVVRSLAKGKGEVIKKTEPIYTPNAFRKWMAEQARMPKALPAPSGKPISAQNVWVSPMTSSPKFDAMTGQKWIRPSTTKKPEPKPAPKLLQSGYVINKNWEKILLNPTKNAIIEESKKGLSPNVKRPNGTPLRNSKNNTSSSNTKWSKQTIVKPSPQVKPVEKTVKPKNLTEWKQSATMGDMETKKLIEPKFTREQATKYMEDNIQKIMKDVRLWKITKEEGKVQMKELQNDMKYLRMWITPEKLKVGKEAILKWVTDKLFKK